MVKYMINKDQKFKIEERILITLKLFYENEGKISDESLARLVSMLGINTSSSTVGRDLTGDKIKNYVSKEEYEKIQEMRSKNKIIGTVKGGKKSASINIICKNENGHFNGCKKR